MTQQEKIIRAKIGLLQLGKELKNVSRVCRTLGVSRDSLELSEFPTGFCRSRREASFKMNRKLVECTVPRGRGFHPLFLRVA